jgi:hypothetical protein
MQNKKLVQSTVRNPRFGQSILRKYVLSTASMRPERFFLGLHCFQLLCILSSSVENDKNNFGLEVQQPQRIYFHV